MSGDVSGGQLAGRRGQVVIPSPFRKVEKFALIMRKKP